MNIRLTPEARSDLRRIHSVIAVDLKNPKAAKNSVESILKDISSLQRFPKLGMSLEAKTGRKTDLFYLISGAYLAFYRIEGQIISVTRILDGRADYLRLIIGDD